MCELMTMAMTAVSTAVSAYSQMQAGRAAASAGRAQQRELDRQAAQRLEAARAEEYNYRVEAGYERSLNEAGMLAHGHSGGGASGLVMDDWTRAIERDASAIRTTGVRDADALAREGATARGEGEAAQRSATVGAFGTLLGGASTVHDKWQTYRSHQPKAPTTFSSRPRLRS